MMIRLAKNNRLRPGGSGRENGRKTGLPESKIRKGFWPGAEATEDDLTTTPAATTPSVSRRPASSMPRHYWHWSVLETTFSL